MVNWVIWQDLARPSHHTARGYEFLRHGQAELFADRQADRQLAREFAGQAQATQPWRMQRDQEID